MKNRDSRFFGYLIIIASIIGLLLMNSCSQYDYTSPLPGSIDLRLRVISNNIAFDPHNNFVLKVTQVTAVRHSDGAQANILADSRALGRTTSVYNTLDDRARDSNLVIGEAYLPPADYDRILMLVTPGEKVVLDGYRNIDVDTLATFSPLIEFSRPFHVDEQKTTSLVLTIDLYSSLVQLSNKYRFIPHVYISSIKYW